MREFFDKLLMSKPRLYTLVVYAITLFIGIAFAYFLLPELLNYAPGSVNTPIDRNYAEGMSYFEQYIIIYFVIFIVEAIWLLVNMRKFKNLHAIYENSKKDKNGYDSYIEIVKKCFTIPKNTFIILAIVPPIVGIAVFLILGFGSNAIAKIMLVLLTIALILGTLSYLGSRAVFRRILHNIKNTIITKKGKLPITHSTLFQIIPVAIICLLSSYFIVESAELENKSLLFKKHYEENIESLVKQSDSVSSLIGRLDEVDYLGDKNNIYFMDQNGTVYSYTNGTVTIYYETLLNEDGTDKAKRIFLLDPVSKNIYVRENGIINKLSAECTYSIQDDKATIINSSQNITINNIYKIDNYAGISYIDLANEKSIDTYIFVDDEFAFVYGNDNVEFKQLDSEADFFFTYSKELSKDFDNRIYGYYGSDTHGALIPMSIGNKSFNVIASYDLSNERIAIIVNTLIIVFIFVAFVIYNFARSFRTDILTVADGIDSLAKGNTENLNDNLLVTSNDEIGKLVVGFNKVQELTKENIKEIKNNEQTLMEKERLASLGEMIGGIAHNMKTPIMSIAGGAEGLTELVSEYRASIDNPVVTPDDHKEIANDMLEWITKIKSHTQYMSDIITAVKGQASQLASTENENFTLYELSKRVEILIKHEIKRALLNLKIDILCDPSIMLHGDINNLVQVINNLISNSIYSYQGTPDKTIFFTIDEDDENVLISVKDTGCGMNEETKSKLFKQMYTTKGKNGTGLGLYMSYSTIRGKFNGNITFTSEENKGTEFIVTIPKN